MHANPSRESGLNALKGFDVTSFYITKEDSDVNMRGTILIPNPSVLTLTLVSIRLTKFRKTGTLHMHIY